MEKSKQDEMNFRVMKALQSMCRNADRDLGLWTRDEQMAYIIAQTANIQGCVATYELMNGENPTLRKIRKDCMEFMRSIGMDDFQDKLEVAIKESDVE